MEPISKFKDWGPALRGRIAIVRTRLAAGIQWWAEHQAWPAIDDIRIDSQRSTCN